MILSLFARMTSSIIIVSQVLCHSFGEPEEINKIIFELNFPLLCIFTCLTRVPFNDLKSPKLSCDHCRKNNLDFENLSFNFVYMNGTGLAIPWKLFLFVYEKS